MRFEQVIIVKPYFVVKHWSVFTCDFVNGNIVLFSNSPLYSLSRYLFVQRRRVSFNINSDFRLEIKQSLEMTRKFGFFLHFLKKWSTICQIKIYILFFIPNLERVMIHIYFIIKLLVFIWIKLPWRPCVQVDSVLIPISFILFWSKRIDILTTERDILINFTITC